jgi:tetratricopeptide (TPR) repeat protein
MMKRGAMKSSRLMKTGLAALAFLAMPGPAPAQSIDTSQAGGWVNEGARAVDRGEFEKGYQLSKRALDSKELSPGNTAAALNNLCIALTGLKRTGEALEACNQAIRLQPGRWSFYNNRANVFFWMGDLDRAMSEYTKALSIRPEEDILQNNIAIIVRAQVEQRRKNRASASPTGA